MVLEMDEVSCSYLIQDYLTQQTVEYINVETLGGLSGLGIKGEGVN